MRDYNPIDRLLINLDQAVRTMFGRPPGTERPGPADTCADPALSPREQAEAARLMRVNHAGEVCAQALYQGQALTARRSGVRTHMERAAAEENDHLIWCAARIRELGGSTSLLNAAWYAGSFAIGALAGSAGDRWSLGFLAETERQVVKHLDRHLRRLPPQDVKSRAILEQMRADEARHAATALEIGGTPPPWPVRQAMKLASRVMTETAYRI